MKQKFNVLTWNFNSDEIEHYDVLPYFRRVYSERKKKMKGKKMQKLLEEHPDMKKYYYVPQTLDEMKGFVKDESMYMFWS